MKIGNNAGDAFIEAAKLFQKGNSAKFEGSRAYENASKSYKRSDPAGKWWIRDGWVGIEN